LEAALQAEASKNVRPVLHSNGKQVLKFAFPEDHDTYDVFDGKMWKVVGSASWEYREPKKDEVFHIHGERVWNLIATGEERKVKKVKKPDQEGFILAAGEVDEDDIDQEDDESWAITAGDERTEREKKENDEIFGNSGSKWVKNKSVATAEDIPEVEGDTEVIEDDEESIEDLFKDARKRHTDRERQVWMDIYANFSPVDDGVHEEVVADDGEEDINDGGGGDAAADGADPAAASEGRVAKKKDAVEQVLVPESFSKRVGKWVGQYIPTVERRVKFEAS